MLRSRPTGQIVSAEMESEDMTSTTNLKRARARAGVTASAIAEFAGVSRMTYYRDERPGSQIPPKRAELYAEVLGVTPSFIVGWEDAA